MAYFIFHKARSLSKSDTVMRSSVIGGDGPVGGHALRKVHNLAESSALYIDEVRFGRSKKLPQKEECEKEKDRKKREMKQIKSTLHSIIIVCSTATTKTSS